MVQFGFGFTQTGSKLHHPIGNPKLDQHFSKLDQNWIKTGSKLDQPIAPGGWMVQFGFSFTQTGSKLHHPIGKSKTGSAFLETGSKLDQNWIKTGSKLDRLKFAFKHGLHLSKQRCPTARAAFPDVCVMTCHHAMTCHDVMI